MPLVPPYVASLTPYVPGKPIEEVERELGISGVAKLASNENALGPSPMALAAAREAAAKVHLYPDGSAYLLRHALAARLGVAFEEVFVGNGSNELIELMVRTFVCEGEEVLTSAHSFVAYRLAAQAHGRTFVEAPMKARFHYDLDGIRARITPHTKIIFLANPDNPTGTWFTESELVPFLEQVPARTLVVMDEAYQEFVDAPGYPRTLELRRRFTNLVVLRTFSKIYGLAGLRIGYALASSAIADLMNRVRQPFNCNNLALAAATAALDDHEFVAKSYALNRSGMEQLLAGLKRLGFSHIPSHGNFITFKAGDAAALNQRLLKLGVIVRPLAGYEMPEWLRVTIGTEAENQRFIDALEQSLA